MMVGRVLPGLSKSHLKFYEVDLLRRLKATSPGMVNFETYLQYIHVCYLFGKASYFLLLYKCIQDFLLQLHMHSGRSKSNSFFFPSNID